MPDLSKRSTTVWHDNILFETQVPLADERNPEHAWCSSCSTLKTIAEFTRKPTKLQFKLWWGDLPYERNKTYIGKECNDCAKTRTKKKNTFDYNAYEETLRLDPKNSVLVPNTFAGRGTKKKPAPTAEFIPLYTALVWEKRLQGRLRMKRKAEENIVKTEEPKYKELVAALRKERNRVKMRITNGCSEQLAEFCKAYVEHLVWLGQRVNDIRYTTIEKAKDSPLDYVNNDVKETQTAKAAYRRLTSRDAEIIKPRYL